jgi:hypothetical protein
MQTVMWKWRWSRVTRELANILWALPQTTPPYDSFKSCFLTSINLFIAVALIHNKLAAVVITSYSVVVSIYFAHEATHLDACIPRTAQKGKAVPLQAWSGLEGSRKLRFPDFTTTAQDGGKVVSLTHRPPLLPGNT